ncbi:hypothetical protein JCM8097_007233 [Rhodosporidiobolus ruineniae]
MAGPAPVERSVPPLTDASAELEAAPPAPHLEGPPDLDDYAWTQSKEHPRNWEQARKWRNTLVIATTGCLSTMSSSIIVPGLTAIQKEYGVSHEVVTLLSGLYVLGLGFGPSVFAPISELYGRQPAYVSSMVGFTLMHLASCFIKNLPGLKLVRFLSGFFGSSAPSLGVATISDLFRPEERARPIAVYSIGPMLGPVIGSLLGSYLNLLHHVPGTPSSQSWRWPLRVMTIIVGLNTLALWLGMRETYESVVGRGWRRERRRVRREKEGRERDGESSFKDEARKVLRRTFSRPPRLLMNPVCALFGLYSAYAYSMTYVFLVSLPLLYAKHTPPTGLFTYAWPATTTGLPYLALAVGFLCSSLTIGIFQDRLYGALSARHGNSGQPEYRLVITQIGMLVFPLGLLVWGWTAQAQTHWMGPFVGSAIFAYGIQLTFNTIQNFIVDAFSPYSAAAIASATLLRSVAGGVLPIFSDQLFLNLGYGWGGTLLACVAVPAIPAPAVLFWTGGRLRERWRFVEGKEG